LLKKRKQDGSGGGGIVPSFAVRVEAEIGIGHVRGRTARRKERRERGLREKKRSGGL